MKKIIKNIIIVIAVMALMLASVPSVFAAASSSIAFSANNVQVGQTVTVTMRFNFGEKALAASCLLNYDPAIFKTDNYNGACKVAFDVGASSSTQTVKLTAIASGACNISITDAKYVPQEGEPREVPISGAAAKLTVVKSGSGTESKLSGNNNLTTIKTASGTLSPKFAANVTDYTVTVPNNFTDGTLTYGLSDSKAKATISGDLDLKVGRTVRKITVTAEDGTQKVYTVTFIRLDESGQVPGEETPEPPTEATVTFGGKEYRVASEFDMVKVPACLKPAEVEASGNTFSGFTDASGRYKYLYLYSEDDGEGAFYRWENNTFTELKYYSAPALDYIILELPELETEPDGYTRADVTVNGFETTGYISASDGDFIVVYAESANGNIGYYRYDKNEETLQRMPGFISDTEKEVRKGGFFASVANADARTKLILGAAALAAAVLIALIVVLIVFLAKKKKTADYGEDETDDDLFLSSDTPKTAEELISETFSGK